MESNINITERVEFFYKTFKTEYDRLKNMIDSSCEGASYELLSDIQSIEPPKTIDNVLSIDYMGDDKLAIVYLIPVFRKENHDSNKIEFEKCKKTCCFVPKFILDSYNNCGELEQKIREYMVDILKNRISEDIDYAEHKIKNAEKEISDLNSIKNLFTKESE